MYELHIKVGRKHASDRKRFFLGGECHEAKVAKQSAFHCRLNAELFLFTDLRFGLQLRGLLWEVPQKLHFGEVALLLLKDLTSPFFHHIPFPASQSSCVPFSKAPSVLKGTLMISSRSSMGTSQKETSPFQMLNHEPRNIGTANKSGLSHALACCDTSRRDFPWGFGTSALFILCAPQDPVCKPTGCSPRVQMSCV